MIFGLGAQKPHHYRETMRVAWENRLARGQRARLRVGDRSRFDGARLQRGRHVDG